MNNQIENTEPQKDFVLKTINNRDVHFLRCWFSDVLGNLKSFAVVPDELERAFSEGMGFDGSSISGFSTIQDSDMLAFPDPSTFQVLPWRPESNAVARMFCNIKTPDGSPFSGDPRYILKQVIIKANSLGFSPSIGTEIEHFYFENSDSTKTLDCGTYFDLTSLDYASDLRRDTVLTLEKMGIPVQYSHHGISPSQHEIDLRYTDALSMADAVMTYKLVVKEIAHKHGVFASFMPKPLEDTPGSSMHIHLSLFDDSGNNAFFDESNKESYCLSKIGLNFIAGILKYAKEFCLITNQYVNSYKQLSVSPNSPSAIAWARNNRSTMLRVPGYRPASADSCRIELRNPDPACNPYLSFAVLIGAGLLGIEQNLVPAPPAETYDFFNMTDDEIVSSGFQKLPATLTDAIDCFESSALMKEILGETIFNFLLDSKKTESKQYQNIITPWEINKYLAVL